MPEDLLQWEELGQFFQLNPFFSFAEKKIQMRMYATETRQNAFQLEWKRKRIAKGPTDPFHMNPERFQSKK